MNKAELIDFMSAEAGLSKVDSKRALEAFLKASSNALVKGDRVALVGFGSFKVANRAARKGRNPRTEEVINIAAKKVVKFIPGNDLAKMVK